MKPANEILIYRTILKAMAAIFMVTGVLFMVWIDNPVIASRALQIFIYFVMFVSSIFILRYLYNERN